MRENLVFEKLNVNAHDLKSCAELIYNTDENLFDFMFKCAKKSGHDAVLEIIKDSKSYFGHPTLYVTLDKSKGKCIAILSAYKGYSIDFNHFFILKHLTLWGKIRHIVYVLPMLRKAFNPNVGHRDFYISNISVLPETRGWGVGRFVLENAIELARENYASRVLLDVSAENIAALSLYRKSGFTDIGKGFINFNGNPFEVLWMAKIL